MPTLKPGQKKVQFVLDEESEMHLTLQEWASKRGLSLGRDTGDPYAQALQKEVRQPARERLLDRLLISAPSHERNNVLGALADNFKRKKFALPE